VIEILEPGPLGTVQDLGRPGHAALGVGASGAADRGSLRLANRLVGNPEGTAGLELTLGGLRARFERPAIVALTGAPCPARVDARAVDMNGPIDVPAGATLTLGAPQEGLRTYLAVRGGIAVPPVLGARCTDLLSGIGPDPLRAGTRLPIGDEAVGFPVVDLAPRPGYAQPPVPALRIVPGPRDDWFAPGALAALCAAEYEVTAQTNRVGTRLDGPPLRRAAEARAELPPEGMVAGALQVPPDGRPILFLADHPVTGGYPVLAVVADADLDRAAQLRPGDRVRFRPLSPTAGPLR
jgi:biotin-dependent carboxylase-like uncharacterized protein